MGSVNDQIHRNSTVIMNFIETLPAQMRRLFAKYLPCCHLQRFCVLHTYELICFQNLGQGLSLRDSNLRPLGQCHDPKLQKGNGWRYPGISRPTYCLTSCSPVVRALVYQPSGPGSIPGMSRSETAITRGKTLRTLLPPTTF